MMEWMAPALAVEQDTEIMLRVREGDSDCMNYLLEKHWERLVVFLQRMVRSRAIAEELAQEAFLRAYLSRDRYEPSAKFSTWLYRIAANRALNWIRDRKFETTTQSLDEVSQLGIRRQLRDFTMPVDDWMEREERREILRGQVQYALSTLPERQRRAVLMHRYEELEYARIAEALGCTVPTVKSLLWRAYTTLRTRLNHVAGYQQ